MKKTAAREESRIGTPLVPGAARARTAIHRHQKKPAATMLMRNVNTSPSLTRGSITEIQKV